MSDKCYTKRMNAFHLQSSSESGIKTCAKCGLKGIRSKPKSPSDRKRTWKELTPVVKGKLELYKESTDDEKVNLDAKHIHGSCLTDLNKITKKLQLCAICRKKLHKGATIEVSDDQREMVEEYRSIEGKPIAQSENLSTAHSECFTLMLEKMSSRESRPFPNIDDLDETPGKYTISDSKIFHT